MTYEFDFKWADTQRSLLELLRRADAQGWEPVGFWRTGNSECDEYEVLLRRRINAPREAPVEVRHAC